jgi:hypothetical protein
VTGTDEAVADQPRARTPATLDEATLGQARLDDEAALAELAEAVARAAFRADERATDGFDPGDDVSAAAAGVVDAALRAVLQRQRNSHNARPDVPLDPELFDRQTLRDLGEFLRHTRQGMLTRQEIVQEARLWRELLALGWPGEAGDAPVLARAIGLLTSLPDAEWEPTPLIPVEPANELERVMAAVAADESARPALWRALWESEVVLPVVAYELIRPEGAHLQFLAGPFDRAPLVMGFAVEERFDALLTPGTWVSRVTPLGRDLPRFWPEGHWLALNPGYENHVVLSPWEIMGLPDAPRTELPHPRAAQIEPVDADDPRIPALVEVLRGLPAIDHVTWARVRPTREADRAPWRDVVIVTVTPADLPGEAATPAEGDARERDARQRDCRERDGGERYDRDGEAAEAAAVRGLSRALPLDQFPKAVVLARQPGVAHPFVEAVVTQGRRLP